MKVNQNISAVISNTQLLRTENHLTAAIERLSSGLRINNAKDDPAGLAISNKMKQQIDGIHQAGRNTQDGTSALNTADGALNEVVSIIQRMHELAVQAANDTNTVEDKEASQKEMAALTKEIDRISQDTEFNTKPLLDGTLDARVYAKGVSRVYVSDYVATGKYQLKVDQIAKQAAFTTPTSSNIVTDIQTAINADKKVILDVNGYKAEFTKEAHLTDEAIRGKIRDAAEKGEATATFNNDGTVTFKSKEYGADGKVNVSYTIEEKDSVDFNLQNMKNEIIPSENQKVTVTIAGQSKEFASPADLTEDALRDLAETNAEIEVSEDGRVKFLEKTFGTHVEVSYKIENPTISWERKVPSTSSSGLKVGKDAEVTLKCKTPTSTESNFETTATATTDGNHIKITDKNGFSMDFLLDPDTTKDTVITLDVTDIGTMNIQSGANEAQQIRVRIPEISSKSLYLDNLDLSTVNGAKAAMQTLDEALSKVSEVRSRIGAYSNRMDHANASLGQTEEDLTAAFSRIKDIDMATEMVDYANLQVLQQAATSVLSQANDIPQQVLQLLQR